MKYNKGFAPLILVAIIAGALVIGGGAYYLGKNSNNNLVKNDNDNKIQTNKDLECLSSQSDPWIEIISPNGEESYTAGQQIEVNWKSCNLKANQELVVSLVYNKETESIIYSGTANDGSETFIIPQNSSFDEKNYKFGNYYKIFIETPGIDAQPQLYASDYSDDFFTINKNDNQISTTLPAKYIGAKNWPPVVQSSTIQYSCIPNSGSGDVPKTVIQKKINNNTYCVTSMIDAGAGQRFGEYTYTTINGNGTKTVSFELGWSSCGGYGGPGDIEYDQCQVTVSNFLNNLDVVIDSLMSK